VFPRSPYTIPPSFVRVQGRAFSCTFNLIPVAILTITIATIDSFQAFLLPLQLHFQHSTSREDQVLPPFLP
jgi:hypothetical protein